MYIQIYIIIYKQLSSILNYSEPNKMSLISDYIPPQEVPQSTSFPFAREFAAKPHQEVALASNR